MSAVTALLVALALQAGEQVEKAAWDPRDAGPDRIDVSAYPPEMQQRYLLFSQKCSKCHPVSRPINSRFDPADWKRYMKRMIRRAGSGINEEQGAEIYEFLKFYAGQVGGKR